MKKIRKDYLGKKQFCAIKRAFVLVLALTIVLTCAPIKGAEQETTTSSGTNQTSKTSDVKTESKNALMALLPTLKNVEKYAYVDMTGDGIKDIFANGIVYTYDSKTKSVKKVQLLYRTNKKLKKFGKVYISKKKKMIYIVCKDKKKYGGDYGRYYTGLFYKMKDIKNVEADEGKYRVEDYRYFARIAKPKKFVSKKDLKKSKKFFIYNYSWNDQDDAWYNYLTTKKMKKKLEKMMPGKKKVKFTSFTK